MPDEKEFFISYTGADVAWARWIAEILRRAGISCIYQERDFPAGFSFVDQIDQAMATTRRTLAILSPEYLASKWCRHEWQTALKKHIEQETGALLPVRVRPCTPPHAIGTIQYIDLLNHAGEAQAQQILLARITSQTSTVAAAFPGAPGTTPSPPAAAPARYPGTRPPHWNVPHARNPYFTGRDALLDRISADLQSGKDVAITQPAAITGLGGIGKTAAAVEYCYRNRDRYEIVWWIRSETPETLRADYADLARELNLPGRVETDIAATVLVVHHWLETHGGWLLVFDNAENAGAVRSYLPAYRPGHNLITSRERNWDRVAKAARVGTLDTDTAAQFLLDRTESEDLDSARTIAGELDGLPLALEHAAAYVGANAGMTLAAWLMLYRAERLRMFDPSVARAPDDHPESVTVTWTMAFEQIRKTQFAEAILNTVAFFAPDDIPRELLAPCVDSENELDLNRALAALTTHSLIEPSAGGFSIHRLVQAVTRERLSPEQLEPVVQHAVTIALNACPKGQVWTDVASWPTYARLLPHMQAAADHAYGNGVRSEELSDLWIYIGLYCEFRLADFATAKHAFETSITIEEALHGPEHLRTAAPATNLGNVLYALGDLQGAKDAHERALKIKEAAYGPDHPDVGRTVCNLGNVLQDLGDLQGAKDAHERTLRIDEATYGPDHPEVATDLNNLGVAREELGDHQGAKNAQERALRIEEAAYGSNHPEVGRTVGNLGIVLRDLGDLQGAKDAHERALRIGEAAYGSDHPAVATSLNNLGVAREELGDHQGAKDAYQRALHICIRFLGPDHPDTKQTERNLKGLTGSGSP